MSHPGHRHRAKPPSSQGLPHRQRWPRRRISGGWAIFLIILAMGAPPSVVGDENGDPSSAEVIDIRYVTLRNQTGKDSPDGYYGQNRDRLRFGRCRLEFSSIWGLAEIAAAAPFYIPDETQKILALDEMTESRFWDESMPGPELAPKLGPDARTWHPVLYLHGYNIGFAKSCRRAAIFQRALGLNGHLILFSWPAAGNLLKYSQDEADLVWSVPHIQYILEQMVAHAGPDKVNVVAHSLGARGVVAALVRMGCGNPAPIQLNQLVLVAPDIDTDIFRRDLHVLRPFVKQISVYVSRNDKALKLSHELHGYPRLGQGGEYLAVFKGIDTLDISSAGTRRFSGHIYHMFHPLVIKDLQCLLHTGTPAHRRPGLQKALQNGLPYWRLDAQVAE